MWLQSPIHVESDPGVLLSTGPDKEGAGEEGLGDNEDLRLLSRAWNRAGLQLLTGQN